MPEAKVLVNVSYMATEKFRIDLKVYEIEANKKHPEGVKVRFILIDEERKLPRLLVDNHAPFGFHMHTQLPDDKDVRIKLPVGTHEEALQEFLKEVERIIRNEDKNFENQV
jgi:hypothetical protein